MTETTTGSNDRHTDNGLTRWFLLTGNRLFVSLIVLLGIGILFVAAGVLGLATVTTSQRVMWYLNGTVNGLLTLVPIAVGVNQIILSHEFGSIQNLYERRTDVTEFRQRIEQRTGTTLSSSHTSTFFGTLLESVSETARVLQNNRSWEADGMMDDVESLARSIGDQADTTRERLQSGNPSMFRTLVILLDYDNSQQFDEVRRLRKFATDRADTQDEFQQIEEYFMDIDAARQYLKTLVVERQLARLSRLLIYTGIPAVGVAVLGIFTYRNTGGLTLPPSFLLIGVGTLIVATLTPLVVLGMYVLRVATIARRTAAYGPFVPDSRD